MSKKLFVGGLAWATTDESLKAAFVPFGNVVEAKVICDRQTGRSRGFGFVTYDNEESANTARQTMHEQTLEGRTIRIDFADDSSPRPNTANRPRRTPMNRQNDASAPHQSEKSSRGEKKRSPLYPAADYNPFVADDGGRGGRDNRRKDKKRDRDRYDDDDRW